MTRFKLLAFVALITLAFGVALVADALAGEKVKTRVVFHSTKWQQIEIGDVEGHIVAVNEAVGIITVLEGDKSTDGAAVRLVSLSDINTKTGIGSIRGYNEATSRDGAKGYEESLVSGYRPNNNSWLQPSPSTVESAGIVSA